MRLVIARFVVVAWVVVDLVMMASVRVDDAVEMKPCKKARVVEVAFSPVPRVVNGKVKLPPVSVPQ